ncbi:MAG: DNA mismatch repair protein MutS, partial [Lachnospiraceae bacterium]|nr:DNA mismatch repair protein MutS [Lachnospiraceae bacterium]
MAELSPMMQKYLETKEQYKDCILFYRLGDFYEMFFEDAKTASRELELTLTGKQCGLEERAPMCGVPFHAVEGYLNRLISRGYKVAICEQVEDPKEAKGLVKREVTRIVTPGTNLDMQSLEESRNNYLMCITYIEDRYGIKVCDVTTGEFSSTEVDTGRKLLDEIYKYTPAEIICNDAFLVSGIDTDELKYRLSVAIYPLEAWYFDNELCERKLKDHFRVDNITCFGLEPEGCGIISAGAMLQYLYETQKNSLDQIRVFNTYDVSGYMILDSATRRNLELTETMRDKKKSGSLLGILDRTRTAMGGRALRAMIEQPLIEKDSINERLDAIEALLKNAITREEIREYLNPVYDLERLMSRVVYKSANPRDITAFGSSLSMLKPIKQQLADFNKGILKRLYDNLDTLDDLYELIASSIADEPPMQIKEGGIIREGYNETVDSLRRAKKEGKGWLADLEAKDRDRTGIKNLKIKYNRVFGYYFEVTNSYKELVPDDYIRKQTLTNAERYTTDELKELEDTILNSEEKLFSLEYDLFCEVRDTLAANIERIQKTAKVIAELDALSSLAHIAEKNRYCRPKINERG